MGEIQNRPFQLSFNASLRAGFQSSRARSLESKMEIPGHFQTNISAVWRFGCEEPCYDYAMASNQQKLKKRASELVRKVRFLDPILLARRQRLVNKANKEMVGRTFAWNGLSLPYFYHVYNSTYGCERAIEIPIAKHFVDTHDDVLEIGNVLSHYYPISHTVVDKYETGDGVRNEDVIDIKDKHKNIVAISTLEHVGWDEAGKDHRKFFIALDSLKAILDGGTLLITVPWGYNPSVDEFIQTFKGNMALYFRDGREWKPGTLDTIKDKVYMAKYPAANAIAVIEIR
jgi:hypothetical protein